MSAGFEEEMEAIRREFLLLARERLAEVSAALDRLAEAPADAAALGRVRHHLHALAGSGTSYGYPQVTARARSAEQRCDVLLADKRPTDEAARQTLRAAAAEIAAALDGDPVR